MCFYRRSEIPSTLIPLADKHHFGDVVDMEHDSDDEELSEKETNENRAPNCDPTAFNRYSHQVDAPPDCGLAEEVGVSRVCPEASFAESTI